ncbi:hypothetical protein A2U01_0108329, partial [Trifolium medium]|nr:hypothetical protein [Trifolium medium]
RSVRGSRNRNTCNRNRIRNRIRNRNRNLKPWLQALSRLDISNSSVQEAPQGLDKLLNLKWLD